MNNDTVLRTIRQALAYGELDLDLAGAGLHELPREVGWLKH
jgi:hypothetical protein